LRGNAHLQGHSWHEPSADALIADIDLDIDLRDGQYGRLVEFVSRNDQGVVETETINRWENIRLRGVDVNQNNVITWRTVPKTKVGIELSPLTYHFARLDNRSVNITRNFQGCYLVSGPGRRIYFAQGRLYDNAVAINLSQFLYQDSVLHIKVWALSGGTRARTYREDTVFVYINGDAGGSVGIQDVKNVFNHFLTTDAGYTFLHRTQCPQCGNLRWCQAGGAGDVHAFIRCSRRNVRNFGLRLCIKSWIGLSFALNHLISD
jgi:hypothetical protein